MKQRRVKAIRRTLSSVESGSRITVNGHGPLTVKERKIVTNGQDNSYVDTFWHVYNPDRERYYRICANDNCTPAPSSKDSGEPSWWKSTEDKKRSGAAEVITQLNFVGGEGEELISDMVAADLLDAVW